jgi:hypothetical protein
MKVLLTIFCSLSLLFTGGCALTLLSIGGGGGVIALGLGLVAALNLVLLMGLWGKDSSWLPAFYILGVADILLGIGGTIFTLTQLDQSDSGLDGPVVMFGAAAILKGGLTLYFARQNKSQAEPPAA